MILETTVEKDKATGKILSTPSSYDPDEKIKYRTRQVMTDFGTANNLRDKPYFEFNNLSLIDRMNQDQMSWNCYVQGVSNDPADDWRSRAFRPIIRNKIITIAAQVAASVIYPKVYAQDENSNEDRDAGMVMRDLMEWSNDHANGEQGYERTFLYSVIGALVNPAALIYTEYAENYRTIKETTDNGKWEEKEVLDEEFSGFQDMVVPVDELWIANFYEHNIQRQPYLIWRRVIDYTTAVAKYGTNENFKKYVKPGLQVLYVDDQNLFYEVYDESLRDTLVEEVIYWNRTADLKIVFVNGVLLDDPDQPNPRKDKKYPWSKTGYELIDEGRFFYYKSLPFKGAPDEEVVNTLYRMIIDGTYINIMPPAVVFGSEEIDSPVIAPGVVTTIDSDNPNASFNTLRTNNNLQAGMNMLEKVESSITESSTAGLMSGQRPGDITAYETSRIEANARVLLDLFAMMMAFLVKDFGMLRINDILQFLTVGDAMEILDAPDRVKFRNFIIPERTVDGKTKTRKITFDMNMPNEPVGEEEMLNMGFDLMEEEKGLGDNTQIVKVNPGVFRKRKFFTKVEAEAVTPKSDAVLKAVNLEEYSLAMANPLTDKEAITKDLLLSSFDRTKDDPDKYMMKPEMMQLNPTGQQPMPVMPENATVKTPSNPAQPSRSLIKNLLSKG